MTTIKFIRNVKSPQPCSRCKSTFLYSDAVKAFICPSPFLLTGPIGNLITEWIYTSKLAGIVYLHPECWQTFKKPYLDNSLEEIKHEKLALLPSA